LEGGGAHVAEVKDADKDKTVDESKAALIADS
jgi:hypothetical protein